VQIGAHQLAVLVFGDVDRESKIDVFLCGPSVSGEGVTSSERLVREGEIPVRDAVLGAQVEDALRMMQARLGTAQHGVHPRALPLTAGKVLDRAHVAPVVPRGVRHVQHPVVVVASAVLLLHELPHLVEERGSETSVLGRWCRVRVHEADRTRSTPGRGKMLVMDDVRELRLVLTVDDYEQALVFYRDVLGLREQAAYTAPNGGLVTLLDAGRATLELANAAQAEFIDEVEVGRRVAGQIRVAFEVADAAGTTRRLADGGAEVIAEPTRTPWNSLNARLTAPDGIQLTLFEELGDH
jgi:lactoylglutathione lyase